MSKPVVAPVSAPCFSHIQTTRTHKSAYFRVWRKHWRKIDFKPRMTLKMLMSSLLLLWWVFLSFKHWTENQMEHMMQCNDRLRFNSLVMPRLKRSILLIACLSIHFSILVQSKWTSHFRTKCDFQTNQGHACSASQHSASNWASHTRQLTWTGAIASLCATIVALARIITIRFWRVHFTIWYVVRCGWRCWR